MQYIPRDLEKTITRVISDSGDEILLLSGARQTGKSTLLQNIPLDVKKVIINLWDEEREIVALRNASTLSTFEQYLNTFFQFKPDRSSILIIDEAQASDHLCSFLMEMHRTWRQQRVILSGSLLVNLYNTAHPLPVGRTVELTCRPLNFGEFLRFRNKENILSLINLEKEPCCDASIHELLLAEYEMFIQWGGMPGIIAALEEKRDTHLLLNSQLDTLYKDADRFIDMERSKGLRAPQYGSILETVFKNASYHIGQPTQNTTLLSSDSPAYRVILPKVIEAMKSWHLLYSLDYETASPTTKKGYNSKKYLYDTGIANFIMNRFLPAKLGEGSQSTAMLLENAILQDIIGSGISTNNIRCYRSSNRVPSELDFVVYTKEKVLPIEVKSTRKVNQKSLSQLIDFCLRRDISNAYVVYVGPYVRKKYNQTLIHYIPPYIMYPLLQREISL